MLKVLDAYSLKARFFPALLAIIPSLAALATLISWQKFGLTSAVATLAMPVLVFAAADLARRLGRRIEEKMYTELGGKPSVAMLRYADTTFDRDTKARYHAFLGSKIGTAPPTAASEAEQPATADAFYERCGAWLRENTRDTKTFSILFNENVTYGFRRNLLGLKPLAVILNFILLCGSIIMLYIGIYSSYNNDYLYRLYIILSLIVIHTIYILFAVDNGSVVSAGRIYARQLLISCEALITKDAVRSKTAPQTRARKTVQKSD